MTLFPWAWLGALIFSSTIHISVVDSQHKAVVDAVCTILDPDRPEATRSTVRTDEEGEAILSPGWIGKALLIVEKTGFQPMTKTDILLTPGIPITFHVTLEVLPVDQTITVTARNDVASVDSEVGTSLPSRVDRDDMKSIPHAGAGVVGAMPPIPGVVRSSTGEISIKGATEQQSALRVNGANLNDPATGNFRLDLPLDSVESMQVFEHPYTVEHGQFVGGVTQVDTRRGGDRWRFELNDFLPDVRIKNSRIRGISQSDPRIHVSGPLVPQKVYVAQSFGYSILKRPVRGLPFPYNETKTETQTSFTQLDRIASGGHTQALTINYSSGRYKFVGLDSFHPQSTTNDNRPFNIVINARDNRQVGLGYLETLVSSARFNSDIWSQGHQELQITPVGWRGNYYADQGRRSARTEIRELYTRPSIRFLTGTHEFKTGVDFNHTTLALNYHARPVSVLRADGSLAERIVFNKRAEAEPVRTSKRIVNLFLQDRWVIRPNLSVDLGIRYENQSVAHETNLVPRIGVAWSPFRNDRTAVRGGYGFFYDKVPLNIRSFARLLTRTVFDYGRDGRTLVGQTDFDHILVDSESGAARAAGTREPGFVPQNRTWNAEFDQVVSSWLSFRANFIESRTSHIYIVEPATSGPGRGSIVVQSTGSTKYRALELTSTLSFPKQRSMVISYIASRSRGDLNDFNTYFGDGGNPILRPNQYSNLPLSMPRRLIMWGAIPLIFRSAIAPIFEVRSGFPYSVSDETQHFVGVRNSARYPAFAALDLELSKEIQVTKNYAVRLAITGFNLTNHFNPSNVHSNLADPSHGRFFASYRRYFAGGFDIIF